MKQPSRRAIAIGLTALCLAVLITVLLCIYAGSVAVDHTLGMVVRRMWEGFAP